MIHIGKKLYVLFAMVLVFTSFYSYSADIGGHSDKAGKSCDAPKRGPRGRTGSAGPTGPTGPCCPGPTGPTGPKGATGPAGGPQVQLDK